MHAHLRPLILVTPASDGRVERCLRAANDEHPLLVVETQKDVVDFIVSAFNAGAEMPAIVLIESFGDVTLRVLHALRHEGVTRSIPIVMLAEQLDHDLLVTAMHARANAVVRVPRDDAELENVMATTRAFWLAHNVPFVPDPSELA